MTIKFNQNFRKQIYQELFKSNQMKHPFFIINNKLNASHKDFETIEKAFKRLELKFKTI